MNLKEETPLPTSDVGRMGCLAAVGQEEHPNG